VAELVRKVIDYEIFAILLLMSNGRNYMCGFKWDIPLEVADRARIKVGRALRDAPPQLRQPMLCERCIKDEFYWMQCRTCTLSWRFL